MQLRKIVLICTIICMVSINALALTNEEKNDRLAELLIEHFKTYQNLDDVKENLLPLLSSLPEEVRDGLLKQFSSIKLMQAQVAKEGLENAVAGKSDEILRLRENLN